MNRRVHIRDAVFGKQNDLHPAFVKKINQVSHDGINRAQIGEYFGFNS